MNLWDEINMRAKIMYEAKQDYGETDTAYINEKFKLQELLGQIYMNLPSFEDEHLNLCIKLFKRTYLDEAFWNALNDVGKYNYTVNDNFRNYFYSSIGWKNSELLDKIIPAEPFLYIDKTDEDGTSKIDMEDKTSPSIEGQFEESHIIIQAQLLLRVISDYETSIGVTKTQENYFRLFYTNDSVSIIKSITSDYELEKISRDKKEFFEAVVDEYITYLYITPCGTVYQLHITKLKNSIQTDKTRNGKNGIFIQEQEISKYLIIEKIKENQENTEEFIKKHSEEYKKMLKSMKSRVSQMRVKYNQFMKILLPQYGSYIFGGSEETDA